MDRKFKFLITLTLLHGSLTFAQPASVSPGGTAESAIGGLDTTARRGLTFLPGVRSSVTYSDNIGSRSDGNKTGGFRVEASPYAFASINNDQGKGEAYLSIRNFYQNSDPSGFYTNRIDFRGNGTFNLYQNWLYLQTSGFAYNVSPLNFGPIAFEAATVPAFNNRFQGFSVAPYIQSNLGTFADYRGQYSYSSSAVTGFQNQRIDQRITGSVRSGSSFNTWGWSWDGDSSERRTVATGSTFARNVSTATIYAIPIQTLRLGAALRYEQIDSLYNKNGKGSGVGPGVSVDWTPTNRTSLRSSVYQQYYGTVQQLAFNHRWERLSLSLAYDKSVITGNDASFLNISSGSLLSAGRFSADLNPAYRTLVAETLYGGYGVPVGLGVVSDAFVFRQGGTLSLNYLLPSGFVSLTGSAIDRETSVQTFDPIFGGISVTGIAVPASGSFLGLVKTKALSLDWEHKLDARSKWRSQITFSESNFPSILRTTQRSTYQTTYSTRISSETTASFGLRRIAQTNTGYLSTKYDENSVFSTLDVRF
jgi:uncharacterized protein (PEP-CTERM system associated)